VWRDVSTAVLHQSLDVSGVAADPQSVFFKPDGTKMYLFASDPSSSVVYQYTLAAPWDLATASYDSVSYTTTVDYGRSLFISPDGTRLYAMGSGRPIRQHTLATPWDIATASSDGTSYAFTGSGTVQGFWISPDGTELLWVHYYLSGKRIRHAALATPWDVATAGSYTSESLPAGSSPFGLFIGPDGIKLLVIDSNRDIRQYTLGTPWDIATLAYDNEMLDVGAEDTQPNEPFVGKGGAKLYMVGAANDSIYEYDLGS